MAWACPALRELEVRWLLKRDDLCGVELSGNKTRKPLGKRQQKQPFGGSLGASEGS